MDLRRKLSIAGVVGLLALGLTAAGCGSDSDDPSPGPAPAATDTSGSGNSDQGGREQAQQAALSAVEDRFGGPASVTGTFNEDDGGARWEVEVTRSDGSEFDVLVSADGEVIRIVEKGGSGSDDSSGGSSDGEQTGGSGSVSRQQAAQVAVAYMEAQQGGSGRVTYSGAEDDGGARWEIEVTMDGGREFDVLVSASGDVVGVK